MLRDTVAFHSTRTDLKASPSKVASLGKPKLPLIAEVAIIKKNVGSNPFKAQISSVQSNQCIVAIDKDKIVSLTQPSTASIDVGLVAILTVFVSALHTPPPVKIFLLPPIIVLPIHLETKVHNGRWVGSGVGIIGALDTVIRQAIIVPTTSGNSQPSTSSL